MTPKGLSDSFGPRSSGEPSQIAHLSFCLSTAKVGKTSLIMSLVSEEFPNVVRDVCKCNVWRCNDSSFDLHSFVESRFPIELRRSPFLLTSRPRGSPRTLWTIRVFLKHVLLLLCRPLEVKAALWTGFFSSVFFQRQNRPTSSCFRRSTRSLPVHWC